MEKQIELWLKNGVISQEQSVIMLNDIKQSKKLSSQNRFIIAVSTIGAALLGIGAILFISANWASMTPMSKVIVMTSATVLAYLLGYYLRYEKKNFPNVGASLLFLSSLLVGASLFLVTQIYHFNANTHGIILIWLILLLPFLYTVRNYAVATLFTIGFYIWLFMFLQETFLVGKYNQHDQFLLVDVYFLTTLMMISIGTLHKTIPLINNVGKAIKWISLQVAMIMLFILTFYDVLDSMQREFGDYLLPSSGLQFISILFAIAAVLLATASWISSQKGIQRSLELYGIIAGTFLITLLSRYYGDATLYSILFNFLIFAISLGIIYTGYQREDIKVVNLGIFWISALIIARYFDFFWDMLDTSVFFLLGGAILIIGAIFMERARRNLKRKFNNNNITNE